MKTTVTVIVFATMLMVSCRQQEDLHHIDDLASSFNGLKMALPNRGKGKGGATHSTFDFSWDDKVLRIVDRGNGLLEITTPTTNGLMVTTNNVVFFSDEGQPTVKTKENIPNN